MGIQASQPGNREDGAPAIRQPEFTTILERPHDRQSAITNGTTSLMLTLSTSRMRISRALAGPLLVMAVAGCSTVGAPSSSQQARDPAQLAPSSGLPSEHVHGVAFNPADDKVYLATHDGLFRYDTTGPVQIGPVIDLMGFTAAGPDHFYSSGHPGVGVDMPNPVGLIESTDAGQTWSALSRQGQTDFHALTASKSGVVGFDGSAVLRTTDGKSWTTLEPPVATHALATSPSGSTILATSRSGPARSTDSGTTWTVHPEAPLLQFVHFADDQAVVGVAPDGRVFVSTDAGATWDQRGGVGQPPQAITSRTQPDGQLEILVVTPDALMRSSDSGSSFTS